MVRKTIQRNRRSDDQLKPISHAALVGDGDMDGGAQGFDHGGGLFLGDLVAEEGAHVTGQCFFTSGSVFRMTAKVVQRVACAVVERWWGGRRGWLWRFG